MGKTLAGDRGIEWDWSFEHLPAGSGQVLDVGPMANFVLSQDALKKGYSVVAIGLEHLQVPEGISYIRHNFLTVDIDTKFDYILNISTIEHVGLTRYGAPRNLDGDLQAMAKLRTLMKPGARHLLTCPIGRDAVVGDYHRVYGHERLPRLLEGYRVLKQAYWVKADDDSQWLSCSKERALAEAPVMPPVPSIIELCYALGGYVLCLA